MTALFDRLRTMIERDGKAVLVSVTEVRGSAPRDVGAAMAIGADGGFGGTIGGGALEWQALADAQALMAGEAPATLATMRHSLGPDLGQCCGGRVVLMLERFGRSDLDWLAAIADADPAIAIGVPSRTGHYRRHAASYSEAAMLEPSEDRRLLPDGRLIERLGRRATDVLLFGAGHVGRAIVLALAPLAFRVHWVDPRPTAFPRHIPQNAESSVERDPARRIAAAADDTIVFVLTHSHALDFEIAMAALSAGRFPLVGMIGSATKRARFASRMRQAGLSDVEIGRLVCPIGLPGINGKEPATIAASVAAQSLLTREKMLSTVPETAGAAVSPLRKAEPIAYEKGMSMVSASAVSSAGAGAAGPLASIVSPLMEARGIVKTFATLRANDGIDLTIMPHEIHALLGENGAGKSTLVKILYGLLQPNEGQVLWQGRPVRLAGPAAARAAGVGMVFQHFSLFETLTVAENVALALAPGTAFAEISSKVAAISTAYGLPLDPERAVHSLSVGERQRIEIVRCLMQDPKLIILDEPTSVLTPQEADQLFLTLERIADEGRAVLYISHRLEEVKRLCHTATILRHGKRVATCDPRRETAASLARMMVGADIASVHTRAPDLNGVVRLTLDGLSLAPAEIHGVMLRDVSLSVRAGEVVAIAGVAGNGQAELFEALSGERTIRRGEAILIGEVAVGGEGVTARRRRGAAFVPEERLGHAAAPRMTLSQNTLLTGHATAGLVRHGLVDLGQAVREADRISEAFDVRKGKRDPEAGSLSGGNLQKFVIGREILREPRLLVVSQPTWGVDAGASATIRQALIDLSRRGTAVLVISQDLDEIFEIADRIAVIHGGRLSPALPAAEMGLERIGLLMGGAAHAA